MAARRENDKARQGGPWPTPIGMGALSSPGDFEAAHARREHEKKEEFVFEMGGMGAVKEYRKKHGY